MEKTSKVATYEEFWPYYLSQHSHPLNRLLHVLGTTGAVLLLFMAPLTSWKLALIAPPFGYGSAWIGHFLFEKNRPATFAYPLWSLRSDLRMAVSTWRELSAIGIVKLRLTEMDRRPVQS